MSATTTPNVPENSALALLLSGGVNATMEGTLNAPDATQVPDGALSGVSLAVGPNTHSLTVGSAVATAESVTLGGAIPAVATGAEQIGPVKPKKAKTKVDVIGPDPISQAAHKIENLTADEAKSMAVELVDGSEFGTFQLGGVLATINEKKHYTQYGYADFKSYVETVFGFSLRKALYLCAIYNGVIEYNIPWETVKHLGWTKLKTILNPNLSILTDTNIGEWVKKAEGMTVLQLEQAVKGANGKTDTAAIENDAGKEVTTMTFKLHPDQKDVVRTALEKAKTLAGTTVDTVALEMIATEFLGHTVKPAAPAEPVLMGAELTNYQPSDAVPEGVSALFGKMGFEKVLEEFEKAFPTIGLHVTVPEG